MNERVFESGSTLPRAGWMTCWSMACVCVGVWCHEWEHCSRSLDELILLPPPTSSFLGIPIPPFLQLLVLVVVLVQLQSSAKRNQTPPLIDQSIRPRHIPQIPIHQPAADLSLAHVDQIPLHGVVQVIRVDDVTIQQAALAPTDLAAALLVDKEPAAQLVGLDLEEARKLFQVHGGVELEVGLNGGRPHGVFDLVEENG